MELTSTNTSEWVTCWASCYLYPNPHLYDDNIGKPLTRDSVITLFTWKNGTPLSTRKKASVQANYLTAIGTAPDLKSIEDGAKYLSDLSGGVIWGIFWLHCLRPNLFPIFDQHTYRAMCWIQNGAGAELPKYNPSKTRLYFEKYIPFLRRFTGCDERFVDKALFAYGKSKKLAG